MLIFIEDAPQIHHTNQSLINKNRALPFFQQLFSSNEIVQMKKKMLKILTLPLMKKWLYLIGMMLLFVVNTNAANSDFFGEREVVAAKGGMYIPETALAQQKVAGWDIPLPDPLAGKFPHTTLGGKIGSDGILYRQSATFTGGSWPLANGEIVPWSRVDWTTHGRPLVHPDPHQHIFNFNNGNNWKYGKAMPFP